MGSVVSANPSWTAYMPRTMKEMAKNNYGVREKDFRLIPCEVRKLYTLFDRITLENHMIRTCGSKMNWVRDIAKRDSRKKKEAMAFLKTLAPAIDLKKSDKEYLKECSKRFKTLTPALEARELKLRTDSQVCKDSITLGRGCIENVVDTMKEMNLQKDCGSEPS
ncbi:unnamed protein product [Phytophthora lilii]|uniref:Unnamed protein product n=1 Tax=Phytophthora lilii TaxID=2077276 RepID=A0A9W6TJ76_9STRA|nr:unnamed protein product [Phytophthora lilii]